MRGTSCGENWVLLWWAGPCSVNLWSNFLLMHGAMLPQCILARGSPVLEPAVTMVELIVTSSKKTYANMPCFPGPLFLLFLTPRQATVDPYLLWRLPNTHRQAWLSLLWGHCSFPLGPGVHKILFVLSKILFPQSYGSSVIKSQWPSKSDSLGIPSPFAGSPGWQVFYGD